MRQKVKIFLLIAAAALTAAVFFKIAAQKTSLRIVDEYNLDKTKFPYVNWRASLKIIKATVAEILDYRTLRTDTGSIVMLCDIDKVVKGNEAVDFLKKEILKKEVIISISGNSSDYSGIFYGVVFYDNARKCLNRELYDKGFVKVRIENMYFITDKWFNVQTD